MLNGLLISDFNVANLASYIKRGGSKPEIGSVRVSYAQVDRVLIDGNADEWEPRPDFTVVWTRPEATLRAFGQLIECGEQLLLEELYQQVDQFAVQLLAAADRTSLLFVPLWAVPPHHLGHGLLDLSRQCGVARALLHANHRLLEALDGHSNVFPLLASKWFELAGPGGYSHRLWYLAKIPFSNEVFKAAAGDLRAGLAGVHGLSRKVVICDLDNTLWSGIVGDDGWRDLVLGGHDPVGEAMLDFQRALKSLTHRGVILAIVSKNEESVALEAIRDHPEMHLKIEDFAAWRINWEDKATNISEVMAELNLGLDSAVFIDDSPFERERVRAAFPEVLVPEWPDDKRRYRDALVSLDCFDRPALTQEDRSRTSMYVAGRRRNELRASAQSLDAWLEQLEVVASFRALSREDLPRATQLLNKTNQMNLSTRRLTAEDYLAWSHDVNHAAFTVRVEDKHGDSGLTGLLGLAAVGGVVQIVDFVLSCRVLGRKIEETMLHVAVEWSRECGLTLVEAVHLPTPKNMPCLAFFRRSGFVSTAEGRFSWNSEQPYPRAATVRLEGWRHGHPSSLARPGQQG